MKTVSKFFTVLAVLTVSLSLNFVRAQDAPPPPDQGPGAPPPDQGDPGDDQGASFQTFYDQLGDQGTWIQTDNYGYVFQPAVTDPNWAPYSDGHWVYTDAGWTWVSDEPWGWATYHYGRWANISGTGWVWVPGYRWAPAWVSWRYGGGYAGWAPLPPETFVGAEYGGGNVGIGFRFGPDVDVNFNIGPGCYNFVNVGDMGYDNYRGHYIDRSRNYTVINNTTNITNINVYNNGATPNAARFRGVSAGGPPIDEVNSHVRTPIQRVQLTATNQAGRSAIQGNSLGVYAPRVNAATMRTARPANVGRTIAHPTFNRGDSITKPMAVNASLRPAAPTPEAIAAAREAEAHVPATARIATEKTRVKTPLTKPLTAMEPVSQIKHTSSEATPAFKSATSPYTGEAQKPATTYHPETAPQPETTYHPQAAPAPTYHPQTEEKPAPTYHPQTEEKPAPTYHPQTEEKPAPTYHPQTEEKPAPTYHPQTEEKPAPTYHPQTEPQHESAPAPTFRPQTEPQHESAPASHPAAAPAAKPAPSGNGNKNADGKKDEQQGH